MDCLLAARPIHRERYSEWGCRDGRFLIKKERKSEIEHAEVQHSKQREY